MGAQLVLKKMMPKNMATVIQLMITLLQGTAAMHLDIVECDQSNGGISEQC